MNDVPSPCPICGRKAVVVHFLDSYDRADYGFGCGCPRYKRNDGIHEEEMICYGETGTQAVEAWERKCKVYEKIEAASVLWW